MNKATFRIIAINLALGCFFLSFPAIAEGPVYSDSNTRKVILANGLTIVAHENHKSPIVAVYILVKCGSAGEGKYAGSGIAHLLEHLMFKSGNDKGVNIASKEIKSLGGVINAFTARDHTVYTTVIPADHVKDALVILKKFILSPSFDAIEIDKEKKVVLDEIRKNNDDPSRVVSDLSWLSAFREHPYKYPVIGYDDLFCRITKQDIEDFFFHRYSPDNMVMVISGDINKKSILNDVKNIFAGAERNFVAANINIAEPPQTKQSYRKEYRSTQLAHGAVSYRSASINDPSLYALDVLAAIMGNGENSILTKELRDAKKVAYAVSCYNDTLRDSGLFYISFVSESGYADSAVNSIMEVVENIRRNGVLDADLQKVKKMIKAAFIDSLQTVEGRAMDLISSEALTNDYLFSRAYVDKIDMVTSDNIKAAAMAYLDSDKANIVLLSPENTDGNFSQPPDTEQFSGSVRVISSDVMPDGARIIICEDRSLPIVTMTLLFLGGVRFETGQNNGVSCLTAKLMLDGTTDKSEEDIKSGIESMGGSVNSISGANSFGVTINLMSADWKKGLGILCDTAMNSVFDNAKIEKEKSLTLAAIKERSDSIVQSGLLLFKKSFFKKHPYGMDSLGMAETVKNLRREDILEYYHLLCRPSNMVLAVTGDVDKDAVLAEIRKWFSSAKKTDIDFPRVSGREEFAKQEEATSLMDREQSIILMGFPAVKITDSDRYAFEVIDSIMSGSDGRLFNNVRGNLGISYSLGSLFMPGIDPGCHIFYAVTKCENIKAAEDAIFKEIRRIKIEAVSEQELEGAKRYLISANMTGLEENASLNLRMAFDELCGLGYNNFESYAHRINSVTAGEVKRVVSQYLDPGKCLIVKICGKKEAGQQVPRNEAAR